MREVQNFDVNSLSLSKTKSSGRPWLAMMVASTKYTNLSAMIVSVVGTKCAILVNRSTPTQIESQTVREEGSIDGGSLTMKSIDTDAQALPFRARGLSFP